MVQVASDPPLSADPAALAGAPSGADDLEVRERWLKRRRAHDLAERRSGLIVVWVALGALLAWLFIAGFAGIAH